MLYHLSYYRACIAYLTDFLDLYKVREICSVSVADIDRWLVEGKS